MKNRCGRPRVIISEADVRARDVPLMIAYGGGVNSAAMLVGCKQRGIRPDAIVFADTGDEKPETYQHAREVMQPLVRREWLPGNV